MYWLCCDLLFLILISFNLLAAFVYDFRFDFLTVLICRGLCGLLLLLVCLGIDPVDIEGLGSCQVLAVQVLEQNVICHSGAELIVLKAAVLDEGADVVPVLVVVLLVGLAHAGELVSDLLGDVIADLLREAVVLKRASGDVQRKVRAVDDALEQHQVLGNDFLDVVGDKYLVVVELDHAFCGLILEIELREVQNSLEVVRIIHVQVDPEQGLLVIPEDVSVELLVLLLGALAGILAPERMCVVEKDRAPADLELLLLRLLAVLFLLGLDDLDHYVIGSSLGFFDRLGCTGILLGEIDLCGHEGAVLLDHFLSLIVVGKFDAVLGEVQSYSRAKRLPAALVHGIGAAAVTLPVYRLRAFLIGKGIDGHQIGHHKGAVEAQSEVTDDLVIVGLVFIFCQKSFRAGKRDVVDVLSDLVRCHADAVVGHSDRPVRGADNNIDPRLVVLGEGIVAHDVKLFKFGDGVASVGDQLSVENIVVAVQPLLDNGKHILAVNGQRSFFCHVIISFTVYMILK